MQPEYLLARARSSVACANQRPVHCCQQPRSGVSRCSRAWPGSAGGYWARSQDDDLIQHSFWLFNTEENARAAAATFNRLRDMPDAPAIFVSVDVCAVIGQA